VVAATARQSPDRRARVFFFITVSVELLFLRRAAC
jgi:hypothetical protein